MTTIPSHCHFLERPMANHTAIKRELEEKLDKLVARVKEIDADLSEHPEEDWEERATETEGDEVLSSVGNLSLDEIEQIRHALHQIEAGTYGICEMCSKPIGVKRLQVMPYARLCIKCKSKEEATGPFSRGRSDT